MICKPRFLVLALGFSLLSAHSVYAQTAAPVSQNNSMPEHTTLAALLAANDEAKPVIPSVKISDFLNFNFHAPANFILKDISINTTQIARDTQEALYKRVGKAIEDAHHVTFDLQKIEDVNIIQNIFSRYITVVGDVETTFKFGNTVEHKFVQETFRFRTFLKTIQTRVKGGVNLVLDSKGLTKDEVTKLVGVVHTTSIETKSAATLYFKDADNTKIGDIIKAASVKVKRTQIENNNNMVVELALEGNINRPSAAELKQMLKSNDGKLLLSQAPGKLLKIEALKVLAQHSTGAASVTSVDVDKGLSSPNPHIIDTTAPGAEPSYHVDYYQLDPSKGKYVWEKETDAKDINQVKSILASLPKEKAAQAIKSERSAKGVDIAIHIAPVSMLDESTKPKQKT